MPLPVSEDFAGSAGALAGPWTQQATQTVNRNGSGVGTTSGADATNGAQAFRNDVTFSGNHRSKIIFRSGAASSAYCGVGVRHGSTGNATKVFYALLATGSATSGQTTLIRRSGGSSTTLANYAQAWANGDVMEIEIVGSSIQPKRNGANLGTAVSDATLTGGAPGIACAQVSGTAPTFDDCECDNVTTPVDGTAAGAGAATGASAAIAQADGSAAGQGAGSGAAAAIAQTGGTAAGQAIATGEGAKVVGVDGSAAGTSTATADGENAAAGSTIVARDGTAAGAAQADGQAAAIAQADGGAAGAGQAAGAAAAIAQSGATAAGGGAASGAAAGIAGSSGSAAGAGGAAGAGAAIAQAQGGAVGAAVAGGASGAIAGASGGADASAGVGGQAASVVGATGSAAGGATATGEGEDANNVVPLKPSVIRAIDPARTWAARDLDRRLAARSLERSFGGVAA